MHTRSDKKYELKNTGVRGQCPRCSAPGFAFGVENRLWHHDDVTVCCDLIITTMLTPIFSTNCGVLTTKLTTILAQTRKVTNFQPSFSFYLPYIKGRWMFHAMATLSYLKFDSFAFSLSKITPHKQGILCLQMVILILKSYLMSWVIPWICIRVIRE